MTFLADTALGVSSGGLASPVYVEDVFSTYLYGGVGGASQAINNGIALGAQTSAGWFNTSSSLLGYSVNVDGSGNVYISGLASVGANTQYLTAKYNSSGAIQWQQYIASGTGFTASIIPKSFVDSSGNMYICGYFNSPAGAFVAKLNTSGAIQWQRRFDTVSTTVFSGVAVDGSGNVYVCGNSTNNGQPGYLVKYNSSGTIQWQKSISGGYSGSYPRFNSVAVDSSGNVYVVGDSYNSSATDSLLLTFKFDTNGNLTWQRQLGEGSLISQGQAGDIAVDSSGNVYVCGGSYYDPTLASGTPAIIAKYNSTGIIQWKRSLNNASPRASSAGNRAYGLALDSSSNVYVVGQADSIGWNTTGAQAYNGGFIAKYNSSGTLQYTNAIYCSATTWIANTANQGISVSAGFYKIAVDSTGSLYTSFGAGSSRLVMKAPTDGTGQSSISLDYIYQYLSNSSFADSASGMIDAAGSFTVATSSLTDAANSASATSTTYSTNLISTPATTGSGGMVWLKDRSNGASTGFDPFIFDTARGVTKSLDTAQNTSSNTVSGTVLNFLSNGFTVGSTNGVGAYGDYFASWTFRKQPYFFDMVTYTGTGVARTVAHNLSCVPGAILIKRTDTNGNWWMYHDNLGAGYPIQLNSTAVQITNSTYFNNTAPTSTVFTVGTNNDVNASGGTYIAYIFATNKTSTGSAVFGSNGNLPIIFTGGCSSDSSGTIQTLTGASPDVGFEPQWILIKQINSGTGNWYIFDNMRGMGAAQNAAQLCANLSTDEPTLTPTQGNPAWVVALNTYLGYQGFTIKNAPINSVFIYIAIRRGPMRTATSATKVFSPDIGTTPSSYSNVPTFVNGFVTDLAISGNRQMPGTPFVFYVQDRVRGMGYTIRSWAAANLFTNTAGAENTTGYTGSISDSNTLFNDQNLGWSSNSSGTTWVDWTFSRAPGFFDIVTWTGDGNATTYKQHNLGVVPELVIKKSRTSTSYAWGVFPPGSSTYLLRFNTTDAALLNYGTALATSTTFQTLGAEDLNMPFVAYLFASLAGISKVGTYSGTGATQTISCGFTGGARYVMVKRTDSTGDWYVWDTARGMVSGTDPYLTTNNAVAEVNANNIYTTTGGFQIVGTGAGINASGGTYLYLAIA